jgi:hypothetical protein
MSQVKKSTGRTHGAEGACGDNVNLARSFFHAFFGYHGNNFFRSRHHYLALGNLFINFLDCTQLFHACSSSTRKNSFRIEREIAKTTTLIFQNIPSAGISTVTIVRLPGFTGPVPPPLWIRVFFI